MSKHWDELGGGIFGLLIVNMLGFLEKHSNDIHAIILSFICAAAGWLGTVLIKTAWNWVFKNKKNIKASE